MKNSVNYLNSLVLILAVVSFTGCNTNDDDDDSPVITEEGTLRLMVHNKALDLDGNSVDLKLDSMGYKTPEGDTISVDHLKYFISDVRLITSAGDTVKGNEVYWLKTQNEGYPSHSSMIDIEGFTPGDYKMLYFNLGVGKQCNTVEACTSGDLDPFSSDGEAMIWNWALGSGYKFLRYEGSFKGNNTSSSGAVDGDFSFHVGGNGNLQEIILTSGDDITIENDKTTMIHLMAMTQQILTNPNSIDLEATSNQGSAGSSNLAENYANGMFMLHHVNDPM